MKKEFACLAINGTCPAYKPFFVRNVLTHRVIQAGLHLHFVKMSGTLRDCLSLRPALCRPDDSLILAAGVEDCPPLAPTMLARTVMKVFESARVLQRYFSEFGYQALLIQAIKHSLNLRRRGQMAWTSTPCGRHSG